MGRSLSPFTPFLYHIRSERRQPVTQQTLAKQNPPPAKLRNQHIFLLSAYNSYAQVSRNLRQMHSKMCVSSHLKFGFAAQNNSS